METDLITYHSLRIWVSEKNSRKIDEILGVETNQDITTWWTLDHIEKENDEYISFVEYFLSILDGKYDKLAEIGIQRDDITIWKIYAYDAQCNMEFSPEEMYNMGKEGIKLCISCYDIHDYDADKYDENGRLIIKE
jgi:hypothetical protein